MNFRFLIPLFLFCIPLFGQYPDWLFLPNNSRLTCLETQGSYLWVGGDAGLMRLNIDTHERKYFHKANTPLPEIIPNTLMDDAQNGVWTALNEGGVAHFNGSDWEIFDGSNAPYQVTAIWRFGKGPGPIIYAYSSYINTGLMQYDGTEWNILTGSDLGLPVDNISLQFSDEEEIWLSANDELFRVKQDGWTQFDSQNSNYSGDRIVEMQKDSEGNIWILHFTALEKFNGNNFSQYTMENTNLPTFFHLQRRIDLPAVYFVDMDIDSEDRIWLVSPDHNRYGQGVNGSLCSFNEAVWEQYSIENSEIPISDLEFVSVDANDNIWFTEYSGMKVYCKRGVVWESVSTSSIADHIVRVTDIIPEPDGSYLFSSYNGLHTYNWITCRSSRNPLYNAIYTTDRNGRLYERTWRTLSALKDDNWELLTENDFAPDESFTYQLCFAVDDEGTVWADYIEKLIIVYDDYGFPLDGAYQEGLAFFKNGEWTFISSGNASLPALNISDILVDLSGEIWMGTSWGILRYDKIQQEFADFTPFENHSISYFGLAVDSLNSIWAGDGNFGFYQYTGDQWVHHDHPDYVQNLISGETRIAVDKDGSLWQNSGRYLIHYDGISWNTYDETNTPFSEFSFPGGPVIDEAGNKWFPATGGIYIYREGGVEYPKADACETDIFSVLAYPNPFQQEIKIILSESFTEVDFLLYDMMGKLLLARTYTATDRFIVDVSGINNGNYLMVVRTADRILGTGIIQARSVSSP